MIFADRTAACSTTAIITATTQLLVPFYVRDLGSYDQNYYYEVTYQHLPPYQDLKIVQVDLE